MYKSTFALGLLSSFVACFPIVTACGQETIREEKTVPVRVEHERTRERDRHARMTPTPIPCQGTCPVVCVGRQCPTKPAATIYRYEDVKIAPVPSCDSPYDDICSQPAPKPRMVVLYDCTCSRLFDSNIESKCTIGEDGKVQPGNSGGITVVFDTCWLR